MEKQRTVLQTKFLSISTTDNVDWMDGSRGAKSFLTTMGPVGSVSVLLTLRRLYSADNGMLERKFGLSAELRRMVRVSAPLPRLDEAVRMIDLTNPGSRGLRRPHLPDIFEAGGTP